MVYLRSLLIFNAVLLGSVASGQKMTVDEKSLLDFARSFPVLQTLEGLPVNATQTTWNSRDIIISRGIKTQENKYYCNFYGVNCNAAGAVDSINLDSAGLTGSLPTSMGNFLSLTYFSVGANYIGGTIPATIGKLTSLKTLRIFDNDVLGTIPTSLSLLTNMVSLELDVNYLNGSIPTFIGTLTKLTTCHLYDNSLTGVIPSNIGSLTNLNYLRWEFNAIDGTIPTAISQLKALHTMHLNNNDLGGPIPSTIGSMTNLKDVVLAQNFLTGTIPDLSALEKLLILDLSSNFLTMGGASEITDSIFSPLTLMGALNLSNNCINFPPMFKAKPTCRIPTPAPTTVRQPTVAPSPFIAKTTPPTTPAPTLDMEPTDDDQSDDADDDDADDDDANDDADDDDADDDADDDDHPSQDDEKDDDEKDDDEKDDDYNGDDYADDDGDDDVVDTTMTIVSQDFMFTGTVKDPEMLEFQMAIGAIVIRLLDLPGSDIISFVSLVKTPIRLLAMRGRALAKAVEYTLVFSLMSTSGRPSAEIVEQLGEIVMDGRLNDALAEEGFTFSVTAVKGPSIVQANSEKSSSITARGSSAPKGFGEGLSKSPLWALVALLAIPLIACAVCVYVGYRCKRKEKKNVLEGLEAEDTSAEMYSTNTGYAYPPEDKKVTDN